MPIRPSRPTSGLRIGRVLGIPIYLHASWFIIFLLITYSLATQFTAQHPDWQPAQHWALGVLVSILFFVSLLIHELGHSVIALRYRIPVISITLFVFGGLARIARDPDRAMQEFNIAIAGPITSFLLSGLCFATSHIIGSSSIFQSAFYWLGEMNLALAIFNLVPGYPLDGGRILRAVAWGVTKDAARATRIASRSGQVVAYLMIGLGILQAVRGDVMGGVWLAFIGWFLLSAAKETLTQATMRDSLHGLRAVDVMSAEIPTVFGSLSLEEYVQEAMRTGQQFHVVGSLVHPVGIVTLQEAQRFPREEWGSASVQAAMLPIQNIRAVSPSEPMLSVLQRMQSEGLNQMPVMDGDKLAGMITREAILRVMQTHQHMDHVAGQ
jgi:Zn-dependent protease/predicted transcriptional regulator